MAELTLTYLENVLPKCGTSKRFPNNPRLALDILFTSLLERCQIDELCRVLN